MIKIVTDYGFCYGVSHAIETFASLRKGQEHIYLTHPILHNEAENRRWMDLVGASFLRPDTILKKEDVVVLSAHGHTLEEESAYKGKARILDLTCPLILSRNRMVPQREEGVSYLYLGKKDHQETIGFLSHFPYFQLIDSKKDVFMQLGEMKIEKKIVFVPQTTSSSCLYHQLLSYLEKKGEIIFSLPLCHCYESRALSSSSFVKSLDYRKDSFLVCGDPSSSNAREILSAVKSANPSLISDIVLEAKDVSKDQLEKNIYITSATSVSKETVEALVIGLEKRVRDLKERHP